ncbi:restriction endonuclease subunit S [Dietzia sp. Alg238-R159]|uniref:restriction endonuclease subunit S n=1 Tax=Dietzia sp. Alg238-R159 TaxID=2305986 RepID=UPI0013D20D31|nr:restriction endonuclease subunit S [Dietzia sp. Alg238-R159]
MYPTQQLRRLARIKNGSDHSQVQDDLGEFPVYGSGGEFARASRPLYSGPSVLLGRKGTIDRPLLVDGEFWTVDTMFCAQPYATVNPTFLYYACTTIPFDLLSTSTALPSMTQGDLNAVRLPAPETETQRLIAEFLDRETAKIDALIDKQEQLIATLREDRAATITHAVTRGIEPQTSVSPSALDWVSEIPDHWGHSRIGYACDLLTGFPFRSEGFTDDSGELPLLRGINVGVQKIDWSSAVYWPRSESADLHSYRLQVGDIVVGLDRPFIGAGTRVAKIHAQDVPSLLLQRVLRLRTSADFENRYVAYLLSGQGFVDHLTPMFTGVSVPHISPGQVASFAIPKPPLHEQRKIADFLDVRCASIDALIDKATEMIDVLGEYRSALITNAVTGRIDVREAV